MKTNVNAVVHYCDGCGRAQMQVNGEDLPNGFYFSLTEISSSGADLTDLYACRPSCINKAIGRRHEIGQDS